MDYIDHAISWIVDFVHHFGYIGIFIMTFVESTFVPIPSEVTMIPAGYLVSQGEMNFWVVLAASIVGTVGGAWFNYWIARRYGRTLFLKYGKYFLLTEAKLTKMEEFFETHGAVSTFTGRLIPGVRHYISFPAGLAKMKHSVFCFYTALGGGLWMLTLLAVGYFIGENEDMMKKYMPIIKICLLSFVALMVVGYIWKHKQNKNKL